MATVYKAYQAALDRYVAVKVLHPFVAAEEEFIRRFHQEARAVAALRHSNIVQVYDFGEENGIYYMVMEFIEGRTLKERLEELRDGGWVMELNEARRIVEQVAEALDYAHRRGMVHRDVKPANIMLTEEGQAILTDFGLARMVEGARFTQTGVAGTPYYMSPEQGQSLEIDSRTDIYSLGIVLYEMLTGRPPYVADTPVAIVLMHVQDPLPPPRRLNPAISPEVEQVLFKALEKEPEKRFQRASELAMAFWEACKASQAEAIKCARCGASLKPGQRFCRRCGAPLAFPEAISPPLAIPEEEISLTGLSCPQCKAPLAPWQNLCPRCGFILESERIQTGLSPLWIVGGVLALLLVTSLVFLASLMIVPEAQKARGASLATPPPPLQVQKAASLTESPTPTEKPSPTPDVAATSTAIAALIRPTLTARAILLSTPSPTTELRPRPTPTPGYLNKIIFKSDRDGEEAFYMMNPDGSEQERLKDAALYAWAAEQEKVSPDGKDVLSVLDNAGNLNIYVGPFGKPPFQITSNAAHDYDPAWSPNESERRIAFVSERWGPGDIFTIAPDGSKDVGLTHNQGTNRHPTWSPDGGQIAFWSDREGRKQIWVMNSDGTGQHNISQSTSNDWDPIWLKRLPR